MEITHHANSFIEIAESDTNLLCDPWISTANHGAWHVVPDIPEAVAIQIVARATHIYISHLHSDHLCMRLLKKCDLRNKIFIISKFPIPTLKQEIEALSPLSILQFEPWVKQQVGDFDLAIIPQVASSTSPTETSINYDLDTSLLVHSKRDKMVFFNKVDNPLPLASITQVMDFSLRTFGRKPDIATFNVGAASEYPQCFLGIDRDFERNRIIEQSLTSFEKEIAIIAPKFAFPAGGLYSLAGGRTVLNKWLAIPEATVVINRAKAASPATTTVDLMGAGSIKTQPTEPFITATEGSWKFPEFNLLRASIFDYETTESTKDDEKCSYEENVALALDTYQRMSAQFVPNLDWSIQIYLYHNFVITESGEISNSKIDHTVHLRDDDSSNIITLHMDCRAFIDAINRKLSWNQLISGSHAMIERQPNIFNPDVLFSLNFFRI